MIRILHAADLHLDSPFQALTREKAIQRRAEQRSLLTRVADAARVHRADIALFAGDLFDAEDIFSDTGRVLVKALGDMAIPVFIAPGNHDYYSPRSAWAGLELPENVHLFTTEAIECVSLPALGVRVWGTAFTGPGRTPPLAGFEAAKDGDLLDVLVVHGEVGVPGSRYGAITEDELRRSGMDYVALGHIHAASGLRRAGDTFYAWPGCPEGRGFDETGEKGVYLIELDAGRCEQEFLPMAARKYEIVTADVTDADPLAAAEAALPPENAEDIVRLVLTGQTDIPPDRTALQRTLEGRCFALDLQDRTTPRREIWSLRHEDSLRGLFLMRLWRRMQDADESERERIQLAARYGLAALENGDEPPLA